MEIKYLHIKTSIPKINWIKPSKFKLHSICFIIHTIKIYIHNNYIYKYHLSHCEYFAFLRLIACYRNIFILWNIYVYTHIFFPHIIYKHTHIYVHTYLLYKSCNWVQWACHGIYFCAECIYLAEMQYKENLLF